MHCFAQLASYKKRRMASETSIRTGVPSLQITVAHRTLDVRQEICYKRKTTNSDIDVRSEEKKEPTDDTSTDVYSQ